MKSKILLLLFACCMIAGKVSAQCYAHFTYQQNPTSTAVIFYVDSTVPGGLLAGNNVYSWSFGDGTAGSGSQISHTYNSSSAADYMVCLTMHDTVGGCTFTTCDTIRVGAANSCTATIAYTNVDSLYSFTVSTTGGSGVSFTWSLNGVTVSTGASPSFVLPDSSNIVSNAVCVSVTDNTGCTSSDCAYITNSNYATCHSYASVTAQDSLYTFTVSHVGTTPVSYAWYYNNTLVDTTATTSIVLDSIALLNNPDICVYVTDASGCVSADCVQIRSTPTGGGGCQAYFVIYADSANGASGYYTGYNYSSGSFGANLLWDFGDGSTSTSPYPSHTYASPGTYIVCLTVGTAGTSCYDTYCDSSFYVFKMESGLMTHLTIAGPTGINDLNANAAVQLYPNPVNNELMITTAAKIEQERIFNMAGQLIYEKKTSSNKIDVSKLSAGIYVLELNSNGTLSRTKFVKD